jgi:class 3 adenylate cyclase
LKNKELTMQSLQEYAGAPHNKGTLALVFTDIVGSTELNNHFGDDQWLFILQQHFDRARQLIAEHHGYLIKFIGDSCMVAFRTTIDAYHFSTQFFLDTGHEFVSIRAGFHFGSVLIVDDDIYGSMVNLTARIQHSVDRSGIAISDPAFKDVKGVLGSIAPLMDEKRTHPELKGFRRQTVWRISNKEMRVAEHERRKARERVGVPQGSAPSPASAPPNRMAGGSLSPSKPVSERPTFQLYPRLKPPVGDKE